MFPGSASTTYPTPPFCCPQLTPSLMLAVLTPSAFLCLFWKVWSFNCSHWSHLVPAVSLRGWLLGGLCQRQLAGVQEVRTLGRKRPAVALGHPQRPVACCRRVTVCRLGPSLPSWPWKVMDVFEMLSLPAYRQVVIACMCVCGVFLGTLGNTAGGLLSFLQENLDNDFFFKIKPSFCFFLVKIQ